MKAFRFTRPRTSAEAAAVLAEDAGALLKAGGVDLLDRMKERVDEPDHVVGLLDVADLDAIRIEESGALTIGAGATLAALAAAPAVQRFLPTLAEAAGQAASPQIRNRATLGGNLAQHTRCGYYRHASFPCLKRGSDACPVRADGGVQEMAGIFGNEACASAHPSSIAPVLGSLDARILVRGAKEERAIEFADFWAAPAKGRAGDTVLAPGEVVEAIELPARTAKQSVGFAEIRQKQAFDWALVSCAVRYERAEGRVVEARVVFGSLAPVPWRSRAAEAVLVGKDVTDEVILEAAAAAVAGATPLAGTACKVKLAQVALKRALQAARGRDA